MAIHIFDHIGQKINLTIRIQFLSKANFYMTPYSNCDRLDVLVSKLPAGGPGGRRENWKTKVDQMKADVRSLQSDFSGFQGIRLFVIRYPYIQSMHTLI